MTRFRLSRGPVVRCPECGVFVTFEESVPSEHRTQFHDDLDERGYIEYFMPFRKGQYREVLGRLGMPSGSTMLDVGASYGWMVQVGLELGFDSYGIEPSPLDYEPGIADRIETVTLEEFASRTDRRFSVVTAWHVMEHLEDPIGAARLIFELLEDGGSAVVALPNASGRMFRLASAMTRLRYRRLVEELFYTWNPNMHRYYFTPDALRHVLSRAGFETVETICMEAFDWRRIWRRSTSRIGRPALRAVGPFIELSRFTARENLIAVAVKACPDRG